MEPGELTWVRQIPALESCRRAGLFRAPSRLDEAIGTAASQAGLQQLDIDLAGCGDKPELLARLAAGLNMPDSFARNWDALEDGLNDLSWLPARGYVVLVRAAPASPAFATALDILAGACREWAQQHTPMWIFILQSGPDESPTDQP